jgi:outer membrane protein assembly factor BamB
VFDDKVFLGSSAESFVILDARTGKVNQRLEVDGPVLTAPAIHEGSVYFSTLNGTLWKIDLQGSVVWSFKGGDTSITELAVRGDRIAFFAGTGDTIQYLLRDLGAKFEVVQKRASSGQTCPTSGPVFVSATDYAYQCFDSEFGTFYLSDRVLTIDTHDTRGTASVRGTLLYRGDKCFDLRAIDPAKLKKHPQQAGTLVTPVWRADRKFLYDGGSHSGPALARDVLAIGSELGRLLFLALEAKENERRPVWHFETTRAGQVNGAISASPAVVDGQVFFGAEDGILYGLGQGPEAAILELPVERREPAAVPGRLKGSEWPTVGGDLGYSCVAGATAIRPPFRIRWRTRVWSTFKGPMIVAEGKVFCSGRSGTLLALDADSGAILWKTHHPGVESRPAPTYANGKVFVLRVQGGQGDSPHVLGASGGPRGEGIWCHEADTGRTLWLRSTPFAYQFNADGLNVFDDRVLLLESDPGGAPCALALNAADGKELWRTKLEGLGARPRASLRFSGAMAADLWCLSVRSLVPGRVGATLALDPKTGQIVWRNHEVSIFNRSRVAARNGVLVVFGRDGGEALDPRTGKRLWTGIGQDRLGNEMYYMQALTDLYLDSKGQRGVLPARGCAYSVFVNGVWYSHDPRTAYSSNSLVGMDESGKIIWERKFLSNACPSPSPAYERLYYAPNAEGVIYCFENDA